MAQAGPKVPLPQDPLSLFSLFFDDDLVGLIVDETNRYAQQTLQGTNKVWETDASSVYLRTVSDAIKHKFYTYSTTDTGT